MENIVVFNKFITRESPIDISVVGETYCDKNYKIERRCSDIMALEYIISGSGTLEIDGQILHPKANSVFLLKKGSNHKYYTDKNNLWHKYWFMFDGTIANGLINEYLPKNKFIFNNINLEKEFAEIYNIAVNKEYDYSKMLSVTSKILFNIILSLSEKENSVSRDRAELIKENLDDMLEQNYSLDNLCQKMNYSKNYVIKLFSEKYGVTPYKYYMDSKIETAKMYLLHSDDTITEIANRFCYTDPQYFATCFKRATGMSPRQFRKNK